MIDVLKKWADLGMDVQAIQNKAMARNLNKILTNQAAHMSGAASLVETTLGDPNTPLYPDPTKWGNDEKGEAACRVLLDETCENCKKRNECPFKDHFWMSCEVWEPVPDSFLFPIIRRIYPNMIASQLVSVQPMASPVNSIFYLKYVRTAELGFWHTHKRVLRMLKEKIKWPLFIRNGNGFLGFFRKVSWMLKNNAPVPRMKSGGWAANLLSKWRKEIGVSVNEIS